MINIIVLNLERAPKRKEKLEHIFEKNGIDNYHFFPAYDARFMTNFTFNANIGEGYGAGRLFQKAELGIIMSHLAVLKFAKMMDYEQIVVLEDDVVLCEDWNDRIQWLLDNLHFDWEHVYLSGHSDYVKFTKYKTNTILAPSPLMVGAFSYMVHKRGYTKIINYCSSFITTFDDMIMHMVKKQILASYAIFPFLSFHDASDSYVWGGETPGHIAHNNNMHSSYSYFKNKLNENN